MYSRCGNAENAKLGNAKLENAVPDNMVGQYGSDWRERQSSN